MHRCGECHPQGFRAFLGLQLQEQDGRTADAEFWKNVLVSLTSEPGCTLSASLQYHQVDLLCDSACKSYTPHARQALHLTLTRG